MFHPFCSATSTRSVHAQTIDSAPSPLWSAAGALPEEAYVNNVARTVNLLSYCCFILFPMFWLVFKFDVVMFLPDFLDVWERMVMLQVRLCHLKVFQVSFLNIIVKA